MLFFAQDFGTRLLFNPTFVSHFSHLISILTDLLIPRKPILGELLVGFYAQEFFGAPMRINEVGERRKMLKGSRTGVLNEKQGGGE